MDDPKAILIEKIKNLIIDMMHYSGDEMPKINYSDYISEQLGYDFKYLSRIFSDAKGITIENYIIAHKVERIKELILYDELSLTQISYQLNYSSLAHLSNQFKKVTGLTPSYFKQMKNKKRIVLEHIGEVEDDFAAAFDNCAQVRAAHARRQLLQVALHVPNVRRLGKTTLCQEAHRRAACLPAVRFNRFDKRLGDPRHGVGVERETQQDAFRLAVCLRKLLRVAHMVEVENFSAASGVGVEAFDEMLQHDRRVAFCPARRAVEDRQPRRRRHPHTARGCQV